MLHRYTGARRHCILTHQPSGARDPDGFMQWVPCLPKHLYLPFTRAQKFIVGPKCHCNTQVQNSNRTSQPAELFFRCCIHNVYPTDGLDGRQLLATGRCLTTPQLSSSDCAYDATKTTLFGIIGDRVALSSRNLAFSTVAASHPNKISHDGTKGLILWDGLCACL